MTEEEKKFNKVILKGHMYVNFPVMIVICLPIGVIVYLDKIEFISLAVLLVGTMISFILGWLVWSFAIVKWRIWAFDKIDESFHYKLKNEAISSNLIWPDGHFFEKTEIRNKEQKAKIKAINDRINELNN